MLAMICFTVSADFVGAICEMKAKMEFRVAGKSGRLRGAQNSWYCLTAELILARVEEASP
jgi:hypothetical protein